MLTRLVLENIAIIRQLELVFQPGFNVITGETGSGKSLILDGIELAFGKRVSPKTLLTFGESRGSVELSFDMGKVRNRKQIEALLKEAGVALEENEMVLSRELTSSGTKCRINGVLVSRELTEALGELMLEIYGQHDLHGLFSSARQRQLVDQIGGAPMAELLNQVSQTWQRVSALQTEWDTLTQQRDAMERQRDFLQYQIDEILQAGVSDPLEDETLKVVRDRLAQRESLFKFALQAAHMLSGDSEFENMSLFTQLSKLQKTVGEGASKDPEFEQWAGELTDIEERLRELFYQIQGYQDSLDTDPERIQEIIDRLDTLEKLKRKYGGSLEAVMKQAAELEMELEQLQQSEDRLDGLEAELAEQRHRYDQLCEALTELRVKLAEALESGISSELKDLMLEAARFAVAVTPAEPSEFGRDQVTFQFSANPGEPLKPLSKVASGGEMSRLMLALKIRTAHCDQVTTLILDEVDTGISGMAARAIADKLETLQRQCQLIVVTHQPIVAAKAKWHWSVHKEIKSDHVEVTAEILKTAKERETVLTRLATGLAKASPEGTQLIRQILKK